MAWLDALSPYCMLPINLKFANLLGLKAAVYMAELLNVYSRVVNKKKDELLENEGYFELDRDYIFKRTTLSLEEQMEIDAALKRLGILDWRENDPIWVAIDASKVASYLVEDDIDAIRQMQKTAKLDRDAQARAKRYSVRINLFAALAETDAEVLEAYKDWIDAILEVKKPITKKAVEIFQNNLNSYTDNKQIKLKVLEAATVHAYGDFAWARQIYEKDYRGNGTFVGVQQKAGAGIDTNSKF